MPTPVPVAPRSAGRRTGRRGVSAAPRTGRRTPLRTGYAEPAAGRPGRRAGGHGPARRAGAATGSSPLRAAPPARGRVAGARAAHPAHVELLTGGPPDAVPVRRRPHPALARPHLSPRRALTPALTPALTRARPPRPGPAAVALAALARAEDRLAGLLGPARALAARSGPFARVLARMAAAASQQAVLIAAEAADDPARRRCSRPSPAEHAAVYVYGVLGARVSGSGQPALVAAAAAAYAVHRGRRDQLTAMVRAAGGEPVAAELELPAAERQPHRGAARGAGRRSSSGGARRSTRGRRQHLAHRPAVGRSAR